MRQIGQLVAIYAAEHDGRGPGGGNGTEGGMTTSDSIAWVDILNAEVLQRPDNTKYIIGARTGASPASTYLACPNFTESTDPNKLYRRSMCYNEDAWGGNIVGNGVGSSGLLVPNPNDMNSFYPSAAPLDLYYYGARIGRFRSDQFLLIEADAGNDVSDGVVASNNLGQLTGPLDPAPFYTSEGVSGGYGPAFRHPFFKGSNFLYFDGHVQTLRPRDDVGDHPSSFSGSTLIGPSHWYMPQ
jgi:prepilin-type processing-associated H-X9-DG protein